MLLALAVGFFLQAIVTEFTPLITLFGTVRLSPAEWMRLTALSATPLVVHELLVAVGMTGALDKRVSHESMEG